MLGQTHTKVYITDKTLDQTGEVTAKVTANNQLSVIPSDNAGSVYDINNPFPVQTQFSDVSSIDSFGRQRSSGPLTLFDSKQIFDNQPLLWDDQEVSGGGTSSTHSVAKAKTTISVSATTAGKRVRQTFQRFNYQPGKSLLIYMTANIDALASGICRRVGYFDDDNGIFFESDGVISVVIRSSTSGSAVDDAVAQADWNLDTMDGNGNSGVTLDPTKTQIMVIDFEWLGVGRVRMGFVVDGTIVYCHQFLNANVNTDVYMSTPNLPLRYEIENDGTGAASSLHHICSTVISEGGQEKLGVVRHASTGALTPLTTGNSYAAIGIRLKSGHLGRNVEIENVSILSQSPNDQLYWELLWNPTVTGTFTFNDQTNSSVQIAIGSANPTVSGGIEINGGFVTTSQAVEATITNALRLGSNIAGTADIIVLKIAPITASITARASITWRELS